MGNLNDIRVSNGINFVRIIIGDWLISNETLKWHECPVSEETFLTLGEIYDQLKSGDGDYTPVIYVWDESPLSGVIYQCGNHEEGVWAEHGKTRGYA